MGRGQKLVLDPEDHRDQWDPRDPPELRVLTGSLEVKVKKENKGQRGLRGSQGCRERPGPKDTRGILVWGYLVLRGLLDLQDEPQLWRAQGSTTLTVTQRSSEVGLDPPAPPACLDLLDPPQRVWSLVPPVETD